MTAPLPDDLRAALAALADIGCDLWGVAPHPEGAAVVVGSGGRALWDRFRAAPPGGPDPLDRFVRDALDALPRRPDRRWIACAADDPEPPDFRALGHAAGLGWRSRLGLLLHPVHGPWIALRAACVVPEPLPPTGPLPDPGPCDGCPAPCAAACPAAALPPTGWRADACLPWQRSHDTCDGGCLARAACPVGAASAYGPAQHRYHHHPASRAAILAHAAGGAP